jgi:dTDP-4-amino-4,6-dideoxygalactose transaminase
LRSAGIGVQVNYIPAYWHPVFNSMGLKLGKYPESDLFYSREISLPMFVALQEAELQRVISNIKELHV